MPSWIERSHETDRLRAMNRSDAELVFRWRNSPRVREMMLNDEEISYATHLAWFDRAIGDPRSRYLVFERQSVPVGLVYFTEIDEKERKCRWGFYTGEAGLLPGTGTVMGGLALRWLFASMHVDSVEAEVLAGNARSLAMHSRLGFARCDTRTASESGSAKRSSVWLKLDRAGWTAASGLSP